MNNFDDVKYPNNTGPTHFLNKEEAIVVTTREKILTSGVVALVGNRRLPKDTKVIVLEECLGLSSIWSYVKLLDDTYGYIINNSLSPLPSTKQSFSCSTDNQHQPDPLTPAIDWREQKPNIVYIDKNSGKACVHLELEYQTVNGKEDLKEKIKEGYYLGTSLILHENNKRYDRQYVEYLTNNFFLFAQAEEYYFPLRNCSTLRVYVTIPIRYLYSNSIPPSEVPADNTEADLEQLFGQAAVNFDDTLFSEKDIEQTNTTNATEQPKYTERIFKDYSQFDNFIKALSYDLGQYQLLYASGEWDILPEGININFVAEIANLNIFFKKINTFIYDNISNAGTANALTPYVNLFTFQDNKWKGKLKFYIDTEDLKIVDIVLFDELTDKKIPLNAGYYSTLNDEIIKNKTIVNYLLKIQKSSILENIVGDIGEKVGEAVNTVAQTANATGNNISAGINQAISSGSATIGSVSQDGAIQNIAGSISEQAANAANSSLDAAQNALNNANVTLKMLNPDEGMRVFLLEKHEPVVTSINRRSMDLAKCIQSNYELLTDVTKNYNNPALIKQYNDARKTTAAKQRELEGDFFQKALSNDISKISDRRLRKLFGLDPLVSKPNDPIGQLNEILEIINLFDIQRFLLEYLKCQTIDFNPQQFNELISKYQNVKKMLDELAITTVCNPYFKNTLKTYSTFTIPVLPTQNSNQSLIEQLLKLVFKVTNDLIVLGIRQLLTQSFKNCIDDKTRNNTPNGFTNNLDPAAGVNDPAINDLLDDLYGGIYDENGDIDPKAQEAAKEKLKNLLDELSNCLSTRELCALLTGKAINDSVIDAIISFIKIKYPDLAGKFNNKDYIVNFFLILGSNIGEEVKVCDDLTFDSTFNKNPLCDDGTIQNLRDALLSGKGLTPDLVNDLLNDINDKKAKNLDDLLKFLDSDEPFDFNNIPSILCQNGVPPAIKISPSMDSFKTLLNTLLKDVYNTFDAEAKNWYKTTYSISSSSPNSLKFDDNGRIVTNVSSDSLGNNDGAQSGSQEFLPSYLFNKNINNISSLTTGTEDYKYISYNIFLNGISQQELDINLIEIGTRENIKNAEDILRKFLGKYNNLYNQYLTFVIAAGGLEGIRTLTTSTQQTNQRNNTGNAVSNTLDAFGKFVGGLYGSQFGSEISKFIRAQDMFLMNNLVDIKDQNKESIAANALLMADSGIPVYLTIMDFLSKSQSQMKSLIQLMANKLRPSSQSTFLDNGVVGSYSDISILLDDAIRSYNSVKESYDVILNSTIKYPSFDINYDNGIKEYFSLKNYDETNLYDISRILVKKNSNNYLRIGTRTKLNEETTKFIFNDLKINKKDFNKIKVLDSYIAYKKDLYNNEIIEDITEEANFDSASLYSSLDNLSFNNLKKKIDNKDNLFNNLHILPITSGSSPKQPYTYYFGDKLVIKQTQEQKACGVRPHYLDIDSIKEDIINEKEKSLCSIEEVKDERLLANQPINTSQLENVETSETQNIILNGTFRLAIRTYLHDILLRSINLFSYFDPQSLRKEQNFIDFMAYLVESEMRGTDNTFFNLMINHFNKMANLTNTKTQEEIQFLQRDMFRDTVEKELQNYVLPKLTKRIWEDTNAYLINQKVIKPEQKIKLNNVLDEYIKANNILIAKNKSVYLRIDKAKAIKVFDGELQAFRSTTDYDLLFNYLFPQTKQLNFLFMMSALSTSTRRSVIEAFKDTKSSIRNLAIITQTNGADVVPDLTNAQDIVNTDDEEMIKKFLFEALIKTPYLIFKGYAESSEPNLLISSGVYRILSAIIPETPSLMIPANSGLLALAGLLPINPIVYGIYLAGLFWYEDKSSNKDAATKSMLLNMLEKSTSDMNCETVTNNNPDKIVLNQEGIYETK